jgi:CubicO group peptidase (beta-lactamase class C family)
VDRSCGTNLKAFAEEHLFSPLEIEVGEWGTDAEGHNNGCGDLHLRPRDAAKFGLLYLNDGMYDGKQIIPVDWVHDSLQQYTEDINITYGFPKNYGLVIGDIGYGYQWWSATAGDHYFDIAWGHGGRHGGQFIVLLNEFDMVIVLTSYPFWLQHDDESWQHELANVNLIGRFIKSLPNQ